MAFGIVTASKWVYIASSTAAEREKVAWRRGSRARRWASTAEFGAESLGGAGGLFDVFRLWEEVALVRAWEMATVPPRAVLRRSTPFSCLTVAVKVASVWSKGWEGAHMCEHTYPHTCVNKGILLP